MAPFPSPPPPLAGLARIDEATRPGLSVEESVRRLKRHHHVLRRTHHLLVSRLTSEPIHELKMAWSLHAWIAAEHVTALRTRVGEMREPPLGLEAVPHAGLEWVFEELLRAPRPELLLGLYEAVLPALDEAFRRHAADTHPLADQPTRRLLRFARLELADVLDYGRKAIQSLVSPAERGAAAPLLDGLRAALSAAGGIDGTAEATGAVPAPLRGATPWKFDGIPQRDGRFADPYNMGVNAEVFLYDAKQPADAKVLMMYYKRLREIDVPEMMASILAETPGKPWSYYRDMTRQLWDEARHAMMGEVGFHDAGVDWPSSVRVNFTWSLGLNTQLAPKERHAVLYFIEQGLMPKTGKRHEWETAIAAANPLAANFQDFDWADEVLHARIGRDWYVSDMPSPHEAVAYGDACWSRVLMGWEEWRRLGHTDHANWWPEAYRQHCTSKGIEPDPQVLAYDTSYQSIRADLKDLTGSA